MRRLEIIRRIFSGVKFCNLTPFGVKLQNDSFGVMLHIKWKIISLRIRICKKQNFLIIIKFECLILDWWCSSRPIGWLRLRHSSIPSLRPISRRWFDVTKCRRFWNRRLYLLKIRYRRRCRSASNFHESTFGPLQKPASNERLGLESWANFSQSAQYINVHWTEPKILSKKIPPPIQFYSYLRFFYSPYIC